MTKRAYARRPAGVFAAFGGCGFFGAACSCALAVVADADGVVDDEGEGDPAGSAWGSSEPP